MIERFPASLARELNAYFVYSDASETRPCSPIKKREEYDYRWRLLNQERGVQGSSAEAQQQQIYGKWARNIPCYVKYTSNLGSVNSISVLIKGKSMLKSPFAAFSRYKFSRLTPSLLHASLLHYSSLARPARGAIIGPIYPSVLRLLVSEFNPDDCRSANTDPIREVSRCGCNLWCSCPLHLDRHFQKDVDPLLGSRNDGL